MVIPLLKGTHTLHPPSSPSSSIILRPSSSVLQALSFNLHPSSVSTAAPSHIRSRLDLYYSPPLLPFSLHPHLSSRLRFHVDVELSLSVFLLPLLLLQPLSFPLPPSPLQSPPPSLPLRTRHALQSSKTGHRQRLSLHSRLGPAHQVCTNQHASASPGRPICISHACMATQMCNSKGRG